MKRQMGRLLCIIMVGLIANLASAAGVWETEFSASTNAAKAANRYVLVDFSGSDWCGWCIRLDKEVFKRKHFRDYAKDNLVCVLLDSPQGKKLKKALQTQNKALRQTYGVRGYPTVLVLSPDGELVARTGYREGGAEAYVEYLKGVIDPHRKKHDIPSPTPLASSGRPSRLGGNKLQALRQVPLARRDDRENRTWTSTSGTTTIASIVETQDEYVVLRKEDGQTIKLRASQLSADDRKFIADLKAREAAQPKAATQ